MKIETKFEIGDSIYFLRPEDWDWLNFKARRVVERALIKRIIKSPVFLFYEAHFPESGVSLPLSEYDFYADEEEAQKACNTWNRLHDLENKENESEIGVYKDFLKECESALAKLKKKLEELER